MEEETNSGRTRNWCFFELLCGNGGNKLVYIWTSFGIVVDGELTRGGGGGLVETMTCVREKQYKEEEEEHIIVTGEKRASGKRTKRHGQLEANKEGGFTTT